MDMISVIFWLGLAAVPLAVLPGWLAGAGSQPLAALVLGREAWKRSATAWPRGVQEDDDVTWQFGDVAQSAEGGDGPDSTTAPGAAPLSVERVRPSLRVRSR
jgi:hypothetical protein